MLCCITVTTSFAAAHSSTWIVIRIIMQHSVRTRCSSLSTNQQQAVGQKGTSDSGLNVQSRNLYPRYCCKAEISARDRSLSVKPTFIIISPCCVFFPEMRKDGSPPREVLAPLFLLFPSTSYLSAISAASTIFLVWGTQSFTVSPPVSLSAHCQRQKAVTAFFLKARN